MHYTSVPSGLGCTGYGLIALHRPISCLSAPQRQNQSFLDENDGDDDDKEKDDCKDKIKQ